MTDLLVLRVISKLLIPLILLFALYVQFHGDFGPGGGFQAGVIFSVGFILHALIYGVDHTRRIVPAAWLRAGIGLGVLLFAGVGVASLFLGGNYLDYSILAAEPTAGQHLGILLVELGVGITVTSVMITIFLTVAARAEDAEEAGEEGAD